MSPKMTNETAGRRIRALEADVVRTSLVALRIRSRWRKCAKGSPDRTVLGVRAARALRVRQTATRNLFHLLAKFRPEEANEIEAEVDG